MATIDENKDIFSRIYDWPQAGDEWSQAWGGPFMQWYGMILPRIHVFLPTQTILEIAPGHGRWTQFLKDQCNSLILVDLSEDCITVCKERFAESSHITYYVNDGKSLDMIPDNTIDFVFSFDSLVHAEDTIIAAYISQLSKKLKKNGVAFIHHSNLGEYEYYLRLQKIPKLRNVLMKLHIIEKGLHWRSFSMTAAKMEHFTRENGLVCIAQEVVTWSTKRILIDCMSTIVKKGSIWSRENRVFRNSSFMKEAKYLSQLSNLYGSMAMNR